MVKVVTDTFWMQKRNPMSKERKIKKVFLAESLDDNENSKFLEAMMPVLWLARVFGVLPLTFQKRKVRFRWVSIAFPHWIFITTLQVAFASLRIVSVFYVENNDSWLGTAQTCTFFCLGVSGSLLLLRVAVKFPQLNVSYGKLERNVELELTTNFKKIILITTVVLMSSAVGETIFSQFDKFYHNTPDGVLDYLREFVIRGHETFVKYLGYSHFLGLFVLIVTEVGTFIWNYLDLFISTITITLIAFIKGFNDRVKSACLELRKGNEVNWTPLKRLHMDLYFLNEQVNDLLGYIVIQSFMTNLTFILLQVYNGLKNMIIATETGSTNNPVSVIYLTWSFLHLLGRLLLVTACCTLYHDSSMDVYSDLLNIDEAQYTEGIRGLIHQMETLSFGITGVGFFLINKGFFIAVAGALLTYEVILLQLSPAKAPPTNSTDM